MKKRFQKIYIEITNRCNLNCAFCPKSIRKYEDMKPENFEYILKQVKEYTNLIYLHVKGEPLMHKDLKQIFDICDKYNIMVNLTTNGTMLKNGLDILMNFKGLRQVNVSIHSAVENNKNDMEVAKYINEVCQCVDILKKNTIISYRLWNVNRIQENQHNKVALDLLAEKYNIPMLYKLARENNYIELEKNIFLNQDIEFKWPNINEKIICTEGTCLGLKKQLAILSNGDVVPCCLDENANILLGNIFETDLGSIINCDKAIRIIEGFNNNKLCEKLCQTCGFIKRFDRK